MYSNIRGNIYTWCSMRNKHAYISTAVCKREYLHRRGNIHTYSNMRGNIHTYSSMRENIDISVWEQTYTQTAIQEGMTRNLQENWEKNAGDLNVEKIV